MQDISALHTVIQDYMADKDAQRYDPIYRWQIMLKQFAADVPISLRFIHDEITDEELFWLSEVFADLLLKTKSKEPLSCLRDRSERVQDAEMKKEILFEVEDAAGVAGLF